MELEWWPHAKSRKTNGTIENLFTYECVDSKEKALDTIAGWAGHYNYHLISAEIKVQPPGRPDMSKWIRVF